MVYISRSYSDGDYYGDHRKKNDFRRDHDKKDDCRDHNKKDDRRDHDKKHDRKNQCFVSTHEFKRENIKLSPNTPLTLFEDFTNNHNKTFIALSPDHDIKVTIKTKGKKEKDCVRPIKEDVPKDSTKIFQVEDFKSLVVTAREFTLLDVNIQKTFCICCNDENDKNHEHHDCDCDCD